MVLVDDLPNLDIHTKKYLYSYLKNVPIEKILNRLEKTQKMDIFAKEKSKI